MKKIVIACMFLISAFSIKANNANAEKKELGISKNEIETVIKDKTTGEALTGVAVYIDEELKGYTDFDGKITLKDVNSGKHTISTSYVSYKESKVKLNTDKSVNIEIAIESL